MPFTMEKQEQLEWCWAAVALSVERYYNPFSSEEQCSIAGDVLKEPNACLYPELYDKMAALDDALNVVHRLKDVKAGRLDFPTLKKELDAGFPVCVEVGWTGGASHFVAITGYQIGPGADRLATIDIIDPLYPASTRAYDEFPANYQGGGTWTNTILTKP